MKTPGTPRGVGLRLFVSVLAVAWSADASGQLLISQFRTRGPLGGNDEFVEIFNSGSVPLDVSGVRLAGSTASPPGVLSTRATLPAGTTLQPRAYYLFTNATASTGYSGTVPGDQPYLTGINDLGGIALVAADGVTVLDSVGMTTGLTCVEGLPVPPLLTNVEQSYRRLESPGSCGPDRDSGNNAADFAWRSPSSPHNSLGGCVQGTCAPPPAGCDDGNACTTTVCDEVAGTCTQAPLVCDDASACTADSCDPATGCVFAPKDCSDTDPCTEDTCDPGTGACAHPPATCDDLNPCTSDSCSPISGCVNAPVEDGSPCGDGDICTGEEFCLGGGCWINSPPICGVPGNLCATAWCEPMVGCMETPVSCDDGNACTATDCDPMAGCLFTPTVCDDGSACTADSCDPATGGCVATPVVCDDANPCTADTCDPGTGCSNGAVADFTPCADADACNGVEVCVAGACQPGAPTSCDDGNPCTADTCDPATGCAHPPLADGTACGDADVCNGVEACGGGVCQTSGALDCGDLDPCTLDTCDPAAGCQHAVAPNGTSCSDGNACNGDEACSAGVCLAGVAPTCDDANRCTTDTCDALLGCANTPVVDGTACADGDACNGAELCAGGACQAGTPLACDDANRCTTDTCDALLGCANAPVVDGTACVDGDVCNGAESCASGICQAGTPLACDDGNPCTADTCDALLGCANTPVVDGTACVDGDVCNGAESCASGICQAGTPLACDDGNPCTADTCDALIGCAHAAEPVTTSCSDGVDCNGAEHCDGAGTCAAGAACPEETGGGCSCGSFGQAGLLSFALAILAVRPRRRRES